MEDHTRWRANLGRALMTNPLFGTRHLNQRTPVPLAPMASMVPKENHHLPVELTVFKKDSKNLLLEVWDQALGNDKRLDLTSIHSNAHGKLNKWSQLFYTLELRREASVFRISYAGGGYSLAPTEFQWFIDHAFVNGTNDLLCQTAGWLAADIMRGQRFAKQHKKLLTSVHEQTLEPHLAFQYIRDHRPF